MLLSPFGNILQGITTGLCDMNCNHCGSRQEQFEEMTSRVFDDTVYALQDLGVGTFELYGLDPLLADGIETQIDILNRSKLRYNILTVGASPKNPAVQKKLLRLIRDKIEPTKGGLVFSVDYTRETAERILAEPWNGSFSLAFKALTFWQLVPELLKAKVSIRTNTVITAHNAHEVTTIMRRVAELGFSASICYVQIAQPEFLELSQRGFSFEKANTFQQYLLEMDLSDATIERIIFGEAVAVVHGLTKGVDNFFNKFRGFDQRESAIPTDKLIELKQGILDLKAEFGDLILPSENYILSLGERGAGCQNLFQQKELKIPMLKVLPTGKLRFCCDLSSPTIEKYSINSMTDYEVREAFVTAMRDDPWVHLCGCFNPCSFSITQDWFAGQTIGKEER